MRLRRIFQRIALVDVDSDGAGAHHPKELPCHGEEVLACSDEIEQHRTRDMDGSLDEVHPGDTGPFLMSTSKKKGT